MPDVQQLRIEAAHKRIKEVFSDGYAFRIPAYQRPYAWETEQVEELLSDLIEAMGPENNADGFYFLGSIVLVKTPDNPDADVVDGQQRLTTLTIVFSVIRDLTEDEVRQSKREKYVKQIANEDEGLPETLRLKLRQRDQAFFEQYVQASGATNNLPTPNGQSGTKARIVENAESVRTELKKMGEEKRGELLQFLLQNCYLVVVEVPTQTAARRIFTVLNARGMDLSATDILKADLLERAGAGNEDQVSQQWEEIENALGRDRFSDLFTHIRMIYERDKPRSALEKGFPEHVPVFRDNPLAFIPSVLQPYSDVFTLSLDSEKIRVRFGNKTADLIRSLDRLDNKDWLPPLLFCLKLNNDGTRTCDDVSDFVFRLERLAYCLFMVRANVNKRMSRYADVLNLLDPSMNQNSDILHEPCLSIHRKEAFELFDKLDGDVYLSTRVVKPILLRLEQASTDGSVYYDYPTISVEHVCPQSFNEESQWADWFADHEVHEDWLHSLGNLVLLDRRKNSAAQNYDFDTKKTTYFSSGDVSAFTLTNEVREYETWTPQDIEKRHYELLSRLAKEWCLDDAFEEWLRRED